MTTDQHLSLKFRNSAADAAMALQHCVGFLAPKSARVAEIEVALAEAFNNIVDHAYDGEGQGEVDISTTEHGNVVCFVQDHGQGISDGSSPSAIQKCTERGRGFTLINALSQNLDIRTSMNGTRLEMEFGR